MKKIRLFSHLLISVNALLALPSCQTQQSTLHFEATVESLQQYECPEWFRDAKFGIWSCWNAYTVPGQGDWYARNMYLEGSKAYNYHCETYGHPSQVGYKDVVDLWKGESFNPEEQLELFEEAGAKYFIAMANHHDNFDLWDSKYQPWNSVNYGPKRNVIGEWYEAVQKTDLRWGITSHLERTWSWLQVAKLADTKGEYKGVPYDGADPRYEQIYLPVEPTGDTSGSQPINATEWWREYWYNRCEDLIDKYNPDLFYVDGGVPFPGDDQGQTGLKMISHLYNHNASLHNGQNEAVMCLKNWYHVAPKGEWGLFWDGIGTLDFERTRSSEILPEPWQTDTYLGAWTWTPTIKYRSAEHLIQELVDVVSKNGNLLLNVSPRPDGTLDDEAIRLLKDIGRWMKINGESIYETRPWLVAGCNDLRVVKKGDDAKLIYVSSLTPIKGDRLVIPFMAKPDKAKVMSVTELSSGDKLEFAESADGLVISGIDSKSGDYVPVFRIEGEELLSYDVGRFKVEAKGNITQELKIWRDASILDRSSNLKSIAYDNNGEKWGINLDNTLQSFVGGEIKSYPHKVQDIDFTVSGYSGFVTTSGEVYFGRELEWKRIADFPKATHLSISESGDIWVITEEQKIWRKEQQGEARALNIGDFLVVDLACGSGGVAAFVDTVGRIRILDEANKIQSFTGAGVTHIDFTPKTDHIVAIYNGEVAAYIDGEWLFTGERATAVAGGKLNDDEIIGWVE